MITGNKIMEYNSLDDIRAHMLEISNKTARELGIIIKVEDEDSTGHTLCAYIQADDDSPEVMGKLHIPAGSPVDKIDLLVTTWKLTLFSQIAQHLVKELQTAHKLISDELGEAYEGKINTHAPHFTVQ